MTQQPTGGRAPQGKEPNPFDDFKAQRAVNLRACQGLKPKEQVKCIQDAQYVYAINTKTPYPDPKSRNDVQSRYEAPYKKAGIENPPKPPEHTAEVRQEQPPAQPPPAAHRPATPKTCAVARAQLAQVTKRCTDLGNLCKQPRFANSMSCRNNRAANRCQLKADQLAANMQNCR